LTIRRTEKRRSLFLHPCGQMRWQIVVSSAGSGESGRSCTAGEYDTPGK
jgi:hypothetical protein